MTEPAEPEHTIDPVHLVGGAEIATRLKVNRSTVGQWESRSDRNAFPLPVRALSMGRVYDWREVERWYLAYVPLKGGRRPGAEPRYRMID